VQEKKNQVCQKILSLFPTKSYPPKAEKVEEICWPLGGEAPTLVEVVAALPFHMIHST
jgi:hypothetical protein